MRKQPQLHLERLVLERGTEWVPSSNGLTVVRIKSGVGYFISRETKLALNPGDVIAFGIPAGAYLRSSVLESLEVQSFSVTLWSLIGIATLLEREFLKPAIEQPGVLPRMFSNIHPAALHYSKMAEEAVEKSFPMRCQMLGIIPLLFADDLLLWQVEPKAPGAYMRFAVLMNHLPAMEFQRLSLTELAEMAGCGPRHFNRLFGLHFGVSVRAKKMLLRLENARYMIEGSDARLSQVAVECGFTSPTQLGVKFKQHFGVTPMECRKKSSALSSGPGLAVPKRPLSKKATARLAASPSA